MPLLTRLIYFLRFRSIKPAILSRSSEQKVMLPQTENTFQSTQCTFDGVKSWFFKWQWCIRSQFLCKRFWRILTHTKAWKWNSIDWHHMFASMTLWPQTAWVKEKRTVASSNFNESIWFFLRFACGTRVILPTRGLVVKKEKAWWQADQKWKHKLPALSHAVKAGPRCSQTKNKKRLTKLHTWCHFWPGVVVFLESVGTALCFAPGKILHSNRLMISCSLHCWSKIEVLVFCSLVVTDFENGRCCVHCRFSHLLGCGDCGIVLGGQVRQIPFVCHD